MSPRRFAATSIPAAPLTQRPYAISAIRRARRSSRSSSRAPRRTARVIASASPAPSSSVSKRSGGGSTSTRSTQEAEASWWAPGRLAPASVTSLHTAPGMSTELYSAPSRSSCPTTASAMTGPLFVTTGLPSDIRELPLYLFLIEVSNWNPHPAHCKKEVHTCHPAELRGLARRKTAQLKELRCQEHLRFPNELFPGLPGGKEYVFWNFDSQRMHGQSPYFFIDSLFHRIIDSFIHWVIETFFHLI